MFYKADCNPKYAIDITDRVKEGLMEDNYR